MKLRFLLPFALAGALMAQTTTPQPTQTPRRARMFQATQLQNYLGLTDSQVSQLKQLRKSEFQSLRPILQQMRTTAKSLREAMQSGNSDAATVGQMMLDLKSLRQQVQQSRQSTQQQALALLNTDQKAKLQSLTEAQKLLPEIRQAQALGLLEGGPHFRGRRGMRMRGQKWAGTPAN